MREQGKGSSLLSRWVWETPINQKISNLKKCGLQPGVSSLAIQNKYGIPEKDWWTQLGSGAPPWISHSSRGCKNMAAKEVALWLEHDCYWDTQTERRGSTALRTQPSFHFSLRLANLDLLLPGLEIFEGKEPVSSAMPSTAPASQLPLLLNKYLTEWWKMAFIEPCLGPGTVLCALYVLTHLRITVTLCDGFYSPCFSDEKNWVSSSNLLNITQPVSDGCGIQTPIYRTSHDAKYLKLVSEC